MKSKPLLGLLLISTVIFIGITFSQYLTLENAKNQHEVLTLYIESHLTTAVLVYFFAYILLTAFSVPGATVVTLLGAALFGFWTSLILVSFASSIGATLAFISSRYLLRNWVQTKFTTKLEVINQGINQNGASYLFSLRLIPIFPFFLINLVMGLTPISTLKFYWVSQLGMLPGTAVYLNAGTQLSDISNLSDIASPSVVISFILLGLFPLTAKWVLANFFSNKEDSD